MLDKTGLFLIGHRRTFSFAFEVQITIQQAISKVAMSGAYIREEYIIYCTSGSHPKNPPDPGGKATMISHQTKSNKIRKHIRHFKIYTTRQQCTQSTDIYYDLLFSCCIFNIYPWCYQL